MSSQTTQRVYATWPMLVALCVVLLVGWSRALEPMDRAVRGGLVSLLQPELSGELPVVLAVDESTIEALGPPPWSQDRWTQLRAQLDAAGFEQVVVLEPTRRLVSNADGGLIAGFVQPTWLERLTPQAPFGDLGLTLRVPAPSGVLLGVGQPANSSFFCELARCPSGDTLSAPLHADLVSSLPSLSLWHVLDGRTTVSLEPGTTVLLGLTDPVHAQHVAVGQSGRSVPWVQAVALSIATLRASAPPPTPGPLLVLPLMALIVVVGAVLAHLELALPVDVWLLAMPVAVGATVGGVVALSVVHVPVLDLMFAGAAGPLAEVLRVRWRTAQFLRGASLQIARADMGTAWGDGLDGDPHALLRRLASLTWNHFPTDRMLYLHRERAGVAVIGGFGLGGDDLRLELLRTRQLSTFAKEGRCDALFRDADMRGHLLPIHRDGDLLGFWCVAWTGEEQEPPADILVDLVRWVERHLLLPDTDEDGGVGALLHLDRELEAISATLDRSADVRAWQGRVLSAMDLPLAIADRAGTIVFRNEAFVALFDPRPPTSIRGLAWSILGEQGLSERMRELFVEHGTLWLNLDADTSLKIVPTGEPIVEGFALVGLNGGAPDSRRREPPVLLRTQRSTHSPGAVLRALAARVDPARLTVIEPDEPVLALVDVSEFHRVVEDLVLAALRTSVPGSPVQITLSQRSARVEVRIGWHGVDDLPLDAFETISAVELPDVLAPFIDARHAYDDLSLWPAEGGRAVVSFTLPAVRAAL